MVYILFAFAICGYLIWRETYIKNIDSSKLKMFEYNELGKVIKYRIYYGKTLLYSMYFDGYFPKTKHKEYSVYVDAKIDMRDISKGYYKIKRKGKIIPIIRKCEVKIK